MALHTDALMDAIVAMVKADPPEGGIVSYPETFPVAEVKAALLPALFIGLDRVELAPGEETLQGQEQHYSLDLIYVMENGSEQYPRKTARQRAEAIVATLEADRTLGIDPEDFDVGDSGCGTLQSDNAIQLWHLENRIARTAVWVTFEVQVSA